MSTPQKNNNFKFNEEEFRGEISPISSNLKEISELSNQTLDNAWKEKTQKERIRIVHNPNSVKEELTEKNKETFMLGILLEIGKGSGKNFRVSKEGVIDSIDDIGYFLYLCIGSHPSNELILYLIKKIRRAEGNLKKIGNVMKLSVCRSIFRRYEKRVYTLFYAIQFHEIL